MLAGLSTCVTVKATPSSTNFLSASNPTGVIPKLVHITSASDSHARTNLGFILDAWFKPERGFAVTTYTGGDNGAQSWSPVEQTPTEVQRFYFSTSSLEFYKGGAATGFKWDTATEYTVEIYN